MGYCTLLTHFLYFQAPGMKYAEGFNTDMGDQFIATKTRIGT